MTKSTGQVAYEAFSKGYMPTLPAKDWNDMRDNQRAAWEAAARAVQATIVGGPVEMRDYDYIALAVDHDICGGSVNLRVPAGTRLYMVKPGAGKVGVTYESGAACKAGAWPHPDSDESRARFNELREQASKEGVQ